MPDTVDHATTLPWLKSGKSPPLEILLALLLLLFSCALSAQSGVSHAERSISISLTTEPPSLNSLRATDNISFQILEHLQEGLLRIDADNHLVAGLAESWELNDTTAVFRLRRDAFWSDGVPVTAHDFVFAWRRVVDPATASSYASILAPIRNASAIAAGKLDPSQLGVTAQDDHTLVVELENPTGYFLQLMPLVTFFPVREDVYRTSQGRYASEPELMVYSGPYRLTKWVHGASLRLEKNPHYWNRENVAIDVIDIPHITPDQTAVFNLFRDGQLAIATSLDTQALASALENRMRIRNSAGNTLVFQSLNHRPGHLTANLNFRRALQAAYDNEELVYRVLGVPGYIPGVSLFPSYLQGVSDRFRVEYPMRKITHDPEQARRLLEEARHELGLEQLPALVLLCDDSPASRVTAQYLQNVYESVLGLEVIIDAQTFKQRLARMQAGEFDITLAAWYPDYEDPMTFADLFASWNSNNRGRFSSEEYDEQVRLAQNTTSPEIRMQAMARIQEIIADQVVILPDYERTTSYVTHPQLEGVQFKATGGSPVFIYARTLPARKGDP